MKIKSFEIQIEYLFVILVFLCAIPFIRNYLANYFVCFLFITFHELSHMLVASICGIKTTKLCIKLSGLNITLKKQP